MTSKKIDPAAVAAAGRVKDFELIATLFDASDPTSSASKSHAIFMLERRYRLPLWRARWLCETTGFGGRAR